MGSSYCCHLTWEVWVLQGVLRNISKLPIMSIQQSSMKTVAQVHAFGKYALSHSLKSFFVIVWGRDILWSKSCIFLFHFLSLLVATYSVSLMLDVMFPLKVNGEANNSDAITAAADIVSPNGDNSTLATETWDSCFSWSDWHFLLENRCQTAQ